MSDQEFTEERVLQVLDTLYSPTTLDNLKQSANSYLEQFQKEVCIKNFKHQFLVSSYLIVVVSIALDSNYYHHD